MFLATTSLQKYWDINQNILLAGEWCKLFGEDLPKNANMDILPFIWSDPKKKLTFIIPARMESTRFPDKPLKLLNKRPVIDWVYNNCLRRRIRKLKNQIKVKYPKI